MEFQKIMKVNKRRQTFLAKRTHDFRKIKNFKHTKFN